MDSRPGVTFLVPVHNAGPRLREVLAAIFSQDDGRPMEVLVIDDGSSDGSGKLLERLARAGRIRLLAGPGRGAAAALNVGMREASHDIVCQVDQDVVVQHGWMQKLCDALLDGSVAAVQGYYHVDRRSRVWARVMGYDLRLRYDGIQGLHVDHVCTGNTAYRRQAVLDVGGFDEALGYGYDNDLSYRLAAVGGLLAFCRSACSIHLWREDLAAYLRQQYGVGYGRLDLIAKHPHRFAGDAVSGWKMIAHAALATIALVFILTAPLAGDAGPWWNAAAAVLLTLLLLERAIAGLQAWHRFSDPAGFAFPMVHFLRDLVWVFATLRWTVRRVLRISPAPVHSMSRRGPKPDQEALEAGY